MDTNTYYGPNQVWICQNKATKQIKSYVLSDNGGSGETSQAGLYCKAVNGELVQPPDYLAKIIAKKANKYDDSFQDVPIIRPHYMANPQQVWKCVDDKNTYYIVGTENKDNVKYLTSDNDQTTIRLAINYCQGSLVRPPEAEAQSVAKTFNATVKSDIADGPYNFNGRKIFANFGQ